MINRLVCTILAMLAVGINTKAQVGFEQYCYLEDKEVFTAVAIFNYESRNYWYVEARYNYEEMNTISVYLGKTFSSEDKLRYSVTPMLGAVAGQFKGGSVGINAVVDYEKIFFSTQSQYTFSIHERREDFFFAWSELGYQPWKWFFVGLSTQQTYLVKVNASLSEPGIMVGFTVGKWTFPLYSFRPMSNNKYFVLGINLSAGALHRNR